MTQQIRRCSVSIPSNIAEGYRRGKREYVQFLKIAQGSCAELETQLSLACDIGLIDRKNEDYKYTYNLQEEVSKLLSTIIKKNELWRFKVKKIVEIIIGMLSKFFSYPLHATPYTLHPTHSPLSFLLHAIRYTLLPILLILLPTPYTLHPVYALPTHLDPSKGMDCSSCHRSHGKAGTVLLITTNDQICFLCHDSSGPGKDIKTEILKNSAHDVINTSQYHQPGEILPETDPNVQRHVSCFDCHNVHRLDSNNKLKGVRGYDGRGTHLKEANSEYQVCYLCHSDSANLPTGSTNVANQFNPVNPSYHPVENFGRNNFVPSLLSGYSTGSLIKCSDCHGNDNPAGPKGPHGSVYTPILSAQYIRTPGPESSNSYALCYKCHSRNSILNDESFKAHKTHVVYNNISCAQCHVAHGTSKNPYLIEFDLNYVFPNSNNELFFQQGNNGKDRCFLSCHINNQSYDHILNNSGQYCINSTVQNCLPNW